MPDPLIFILLAIFVLIVSILLKKHKRSLPKSYPYEPIKSFLTPAERSFLGVLDSVAGSDCRIFSKVRLADVIAVKNGLSKSARQSALNRINRKHIDFVICNPADLSILCAVELDDRSHNRTDRKERDQFIDKALDTAGIPILHIKTKAGYTPAELLAALANVKGIKPTASNSVGPESEVSHTSNEPTQSEPGNSPVCPKCGEPLVSREAKKGKHSGEKFWGCSNFPKCRFVSKPEENQPESNENQMWAPPELLVKGAGVDQTG